MASTLHLISVTLLLFALTNAAITTGLEEDELQSMLNVLRDTGYNLFGNAITTSDLFYEILLSGKTFTFFAPTDSSLFALDMTNSATEYTAYLRCHVIPVRISFSELRRFPSGSSFPTLLKDSRITFLFQRRSFVTASDEVISVGGMRVTYPGLFYSRNLAVHGLAGTISCRPHQESPSPSPVKSPLINLHDNHRHSPPPMHKNLTGISHPHSPSANSSGDSNLLSPISRSQSQPLHSSGIHKFGYPIHSQSQSPSPSPNSGDADNHYMKSAEAGAPELGGFSETPAINLPPDVSPAYDVWPPLPESETFDSGMVLPPAEFSENDDPISFPPSDYENVENQSIDKLSAESDLASLNENDLLSPHDEEGKNAIANYVPMLSGEDPDGMIEESPEKNGAYDEMSRDCPRSDGFTKISFFPSTTTHMLCTGE